jgi:hypothetical protein
MRYKSVAVPGPSVGAPGIKVKKVQPNMALSLEEILERFTRGESLEIGAGEGQYDDGPEDLEKMAHADLVDKAEAAEAFKGTQKKYKKQEADKAKKEKERLDKLAVEKLAADKLAAEKSKVIP